MSQNKSLREQLDNLVELFKKLREKANEEQFGHLDKTFFNNIDLLVNNYELFKRNFSDEVLNEISEPIQKLIVQAVDHLKAELGEPDANQIELRSDIDRIDELLQNPNLSIDEIDNLLDKRRKIKEGQ
jgi:DNA mismatch repair ATPase MutS